MRELSLFTGGGGGLLASVRAGIEVVAGFEIVPYAREVIYARQRDGFLPEFPVLPDVRGFDGHYLRGKVDLLTGGVPCQAFSSAGTRKGADDERNLWPDTIRLLGEVAPEAAFFENVSRLTSLPYFHEYIVPRIAHLGYGVRWLRVQAAHAGAPHKRDRVWIWASRDMVPRGNPGLAAQGDGEYIGGAWYGLPRVGGVTRATVGPHQCEFPTPDASRYGSSGNTGGGNTLSAHRPSLDTMAARDMWPTPRANPNENRTTRPTPTQEAGRHGRYLASEVLSRPMWPTTTCSDARSSGRAGYAGASHPGTTLTDAVLSRPAFPTPASTDWKGVSRDGQRRGQLEEAIKFHVDEPPPAGVQLAPGFSEWLMHWPVGWTDLAPLPPERWREWLEATPEEWWAVERSVRVLPRGADEERVKRLTAIGNGQVPACALLAMEMLR